MITYFPINFNDLFKSWTYSNSFCSVDDNIFKTNWEKVEDGYQWKLDVPGFKKDNLKITFDSDTRLISINGESKNRIVKVKILLPKNAETLTSKVEDGILYLSAKKIKTSQKKVIEIPIE